MQMYYFLETGSSARRKLNPAKRRMLRELKTKPIRNSEISISLFDLLLMMTMMMSLRMDTNKKRR